MLLASEYFFRFLTDRPFRGLPNNNSVATLYNKHLWTLKLKLFSAAMGFSCLTLFIRWVASALSMEPIMSAYLLLSAIYRVIELADGWNGRIIATQVYFSTSPLPSDVCVVADGVPQTC